MSYSGPNTGIKRGIKLNLIPLFILIVLNKKMLIRLIIKI